VIHVTTLKLGTWESAYRTIKVFTYAWDYEIPKALIEDILWLILDFKKQLNISETQTNEFTEF
jgi:hypothetical protein